MGRAPATLALCCAAVYLLLAAGGAAAQQLTPFQGRNAPPEGGVDVYVSAIVDHLIEVDDSKYKFQVGEPVGCCGHTGRCV